MHLPLFFFFFTETGSLYLLKWITVQVLRAGAWWEGYSLVLFWSVVAVGGVVFFFKVLLMLLLLLLSCFSNSCHIHVSLLQLHKVTYLFVVWASKPGDGE